jgi:hypothetical protein
MADRSRTSMSYAILFLPGIKAFTGLDEGSEAQPSSTAAGLETAFKLSPGVQPNVVNPSIHKKENAS